MDQTQKSLTLTLFSTILTLYNGNTKTRTLHEDTLEDITCTIVSHFHTVNSLNACHKFSKHLPNRAF